MKPIPVQLNNLKFCSTMFLITGSPTVLRLVRKNQGRFNDDSHSLNGTLAIENNWGRPHIALTNTGGGDKYLRGSSLTWEIPADSNGQKGSLYEYFWWRQILWLGAANQFGFIKISVTDANGVFLYGVETYKHTNGFDCHYNFLAGDGKGGYKVLDRKHFYGTHVSTANPFNEPQGLVGCSTL